MTPPASVPTISAKRIRLSHFVYDVISKVYDFGQLPIIPLKKAAVNELDLKRGDHVIVFCCGTGLEFLFIQHRIGPEGKILGVDWSDGMLERARRRIMDNGWTNVEVVKGDVTALPAGVVETASYDAGICTLGLSIISEPEKAFQALKNAVRVGQRIVIGDVCSFAGLKSILNPLHTLGDLPAGNTHRSLAHSRVFAEALPSRLLDVKLKWHRGGGYYIASGRIPDAERSLVSSADQP
jgi:ubiquinone/menaquinone biosynthesis C-methylase UbiE